MEDERPILCMEHCRGHKIFGFGVPSHCPACGSDLSTADLRIPPFRLPSPFRPAGSNPCSIVLKPTTGDFLTDYKNSDNLHIGLTSSQGLVYEYDADGLRKDKGATWARSLSIRDLNRDPRGRKGSVLENSRGSLANIESWSQYWDFTLEVIAGQSLWTKDRYNEAGHNCYSFVLSFLRALQAPGLSGSARDRAVFTQEFIVPKTAAAAKYITLYRKLMTQN